MIPKSGYRFSEKIMLEQVSHPPFNSRPQGAAGTCRIREVRIPLTEARKPWQDRRMLFGGSSPAASRRLAHGFASSPQTMRETD
jgi:hypothetical protein